MSLSNYGFWFSSITLHIGIWHSYCRLFIVEHVYLSPAYMFGTWILLPTHILDLSILIWLTDLHGFTIHYYYITIWLNLCRTWIEQSVTQALSIWWLSRLLTYNLSLVFSLCLNISSIFIVILPYRYCLESRSLVIYACDSIVHWISHLSHIGG